MAEVISNTSPIQYLYQSGLLAIIPSLVGSVLIPPAVEAELAAGRASDLDLPNPAQLSWIAIRPPHRPASPQLPIGLGAGETEVLELAVECADSIVILDDLLARQAAHSLGIRLTGTLGLLLDAKRAGLIESIEPVLDTLQQLRFRLSSRTRAIVSKLAGENR